jgi:hypothetical protein
LNNPFFAKISCYDVLLFTKADFHAVFLVHKFYLIFVMPSFQGEPK